MPTFVVLLFTVIAGTAITGTAIAASDTRIETEAPSIRSDSTPWTSLEALDDASRFHFVVVTDRTGGHRDGVFADAMKRVNLLQADIWTERFGPDHYAFRYEDVLFFVLNAALFDREGVDGHGRRRFRSHR